MTTTTPGASFHRGTAQLINQTSGDVEYYTPVEIIEAARATMGGIDFDPASSFNANKVVKAERIFTCDDGEISLKQPWPGRVFMNHPFGKAEPACLPGCTKNHNHHSFDYYGNAAWVKKFIHEWQEGPMDEGICITFAATSEKWFQPLLQCPQCFLHPRTNYRTPDGKIKQGVSKGSVVTYVGDADFGIARFWKHFHTFGTIKIAV